MGRACRPSSKPLPDRNLAELLRRSADRFADNTAFTICLDNGMTASLTYRQVQAHSDAFAAYLRKEAEAEQQSRQTGT